MFGPLPRLHLITLATAVGRGLPRRRALGRSRSPSCRSPCPSAPRSARSRASRWPGLWSTTSTGARPSPSAPYAADPSREARPARDRSRNSPHGPRNSSLRPSPAMIVALFALVVSMSAGAYAVVIAPKNSVVSKSIKNGQVKTKDLKANAVKGPAGKGRFPHRRGHRRRIDQPRRSVGGGQDGPQQRRQRHQRQHGGRTQRRSDRRGHRRQVFRGSSGRRQHRHRDAEPGQHREPGPGGWKYLINARVPVYCVYSGAGAPAAPAPNQPFYGATGHLVVGGSTVESASTTCEAEAMADASLFGSDSYYGRSTVDITRQVTLNAATTITLRANGTNDGISSGPASWPTASMPAPVSPSSRRSPSTSDSLIDRNNDSGPAELTLRGPLPCWVSLRP